MSDWCWPTSVASEDRSDQDFRSGKRTTACCTTKKKISDCASLCKSKSKFFNIYTKIFKYLQQTFEVSAQALLSIKYVLKITKRIHK